MLVLRMQTVVLELLLLNLLELKLVANNLIVTVLRVRCVRVRAERRAKAAAAAVGPIEMGNIAHMMHTAAAAAAAVAGHAQAIARYHARTSVEKGQTRIRVELRLEQASELLRVDRRQRQCVCNEALVRRR